MNTKHFFEALIFCSAVFWFGLLLWLVLPAAASIIGRVIAVSACVYGECCVVAWFWNIYQDAKAKR